MLREWAPLSASADLPRLLWALLALAGSLALLATAWSVLHPSMVDMLVYRAEGAAIVRGQDMYHLVHSPEGLQATYPPFAALLFVPLTWIPTWLARIGVTLGNIGLLVGVVAASLALTQRSAGRPPVRALAPIAGLVALALWFEPVYTTLRYGQVNLLLALLILGDFLLLRGPHRGWAGVGVGLAAAIKLTPGVFVVYLLVTRRFRQAATALGAFVVAGLMGCLAEPTGSWRYWTSLMFDTRRVGSTEDTANQSLSGVLARVLHTPHPGLVWVALAVPVFVVGLGVATWFARRGDELLGLIVCGVTGLLVSPISWTHHWIWCVPAFVVFAIRGGTTAVRVALFGCGLVAVGYLPWIPSRADYAQLHEHGLDWLLSSSDVVVGLLFLVVATAVAVNRQRRGGRGGASLKADAGREGARVW